MPPSLFPPNLVNYVGIGVIILLGLVISTAAQEGVKKYLRNGSADRRVGDDRLFSRIVEVHDSLLTHLKSISDNQEKISHILQNMIERQDIRHEKVTGELSDIKQILKG